MRPLAFVDLETTGATATTDRITEIGIIEVDTDGSMREWQQLVNPGPRHPEERSDEGSPNRRAVQDD